MDAGCTLRISVDSVQEQQKAQRPQEYRYQPPH
jgi:hypothetical protein